MKCPCCGREMTSGFVRSARGIYYTNKARKTLMDPIHDLENEIRLSSHNWARPVCIAYHCSDCKKVVIDYSEKVK